MNLWQKWLSGLRTKAARSTSYLSTLFTMRYSGATFGKGLSYMEAVNQGYKNVVWVYRCIDAINSAVGSVPWRVYRVTGDGQEELLPGHPLELLLNRPNKFYGRKEFFDAWGTSLGLSGKAYWEVVFLRDVPVELYPIRPDWMRPVPHPELYVSGYVFDPKVPGRTPIPYEPKEIVEFRYQDPLNEYGGLSPLTAASRTLAVENAATTWNQSLLENSAVPGGILSVPANILQTTKREELKESIESEFSGSNRHRAMVLWGGMEWKQMGLAPGDVQFLEQRRTNKYELCAIYGVPPQVVGAQEDPTYSNYSVARLSFWEDRIIPLLMWVEAKANSDLAPFYGPDVVARPDLTQVPALREAFSQKVKAASDLWKMGWPINDINRRVGLGMNEVSWGNTAYLPLNVVPASSFGGEETPDAEETPTTEEESNQRDDMLEQDQEQDPYTGALNTKPPIAR